MTTQNQIRQIFTSHWCRSGSQAGKLAWLIKGDFDRFKLMNELYGSLLSDYLLDWTLDVIEAELTSYQKQVGGTELFWNFVGDDVTIYIPPSSLQKADVDDLLWRICDAIEKSFFRHYRVGAIPLPSDIFDDIPADHLEALRNQLERMDVVLDFVRRRQGYLVLFPVGEDGRYGPSLDGICQVLQKRSGRRLSPLKLQLDWIWDPDIQACHGFNQGFLLPPSVSFAACSITMGGEAGSISHDRRSIYERVSLACQAALKLCKQQRKQVWVQDTGSAILDVYPAYQPSGVLALYSPLRWSSERYLRETLYFRLLDRPVLFQFNPVYHSHSELYATAVGGDPARVEKYRGNKYGIGLKGINEIFGQSTADCLIGELTWVFSKVLQSALVGKGIPLESVHVARFVDRFTVCCEQPVFQLSEITELVSRLAELFNSVSDGINISHLRIGLALGERRITGSRLFHQLALTSLSPRSSFLENSDPPLELRQYSASFTLREGSIALERNSFASARLLEDYHGFIPRRRHVPGLPLESHSYVG
jgi:hypothetical protein